MRFVAGEQAQVRIKARRGGIVISRAQMRVTANLSIRIFAHDHQQLGVRLQSHQPVKHLHAGVFKTSRPSDVGGFIKAGFQLHHHGYFFFARGFQQRQGDRRIRVGAIERLLDGQHARVVRRCAQEIHHRVVAIVRMVQQHVLTAQGFETTNPRRGQFAPVAAQTFHTSNPDAPSPHTNERAAARLTGPATRNTSDSSSSNVETR